MPFPLVLDLGIDLSVALQADRAAQVVHGPQVFHPARVEDLEQDGLLHLAHLGPLLGVEGVEQRAADLGRGHRLELVGADLQLQGLVGPGGQIGQGRGIGWRSVLVGAGAGEPGGRELGLELLGQPGSLVVLVSQADQALLDLGAEQGAELFGVDDGVVALATPRRPGLLGRSGGSGCCDRSPRYLIRAIRAGSSASFWA